MFKPLLALLSVLVAATMLLSACGPGQFLGPTLTPTATITPLPTSTYTPSPTNTSTPTMTLTPTPTLGVGSSWSSPDDGMTMLFVPGGEFLMGNDNGDNSEKPAHTIHLDSYWIDQTEVTNAMYAKCVQAGRCKAPSSNESNHRSNYYGNSEYDNYPVMYVSWDGANDYCEWRGDGTGLPTEAQWEKAASWDDKNKRKYIHPWGDDSPNGDLLNVTPGEDTTEVGTFPKGASFYGALDMAGNVLEWVADWYSETYYADSPSSNPLGPDIGKDRVVRGGGGWSITWSSVGGILRGYPVPLVRSSYRSWLAPDRAGIGLGFRCARSLP